MIFQASFLIVLLGCLFVLSLLEASIAAMSQVNLRVMLDRDPDHRIKLLEDLVQDRAEFLLPLQFALQVLTAVTAIVLARLLVLGGNDSVVRPIAGMVLVVASVRQLIPNWLAQNRPEACLLTLLPILRGPYALIAFLSTPILWSLRRKKERLASGGRNDGETEEASEEEIQAYINVGEEQGIFEEHESQLIQSALEFKSTLVREIMTPRAQIVSIAQSASVSQLAALMASSKHSRIPVYRDNQDSVVGVVYVRTLVSYLSDGKGEDPITGLVKDVWFVPETKKVTELLKEMQRESQSLAIVVSEFGAVSGVVTIEDLVEEIVGEIYDEDELHDTGVVDEGRGNFKVAGWMDVSDVEEALGMDLGDTPATTFSGLVVEHLGRVPLSGQTIELNGFTIKVLDSDNKRINLMRVASLHEHGHPEKKAAG